MSFLDEPCRFCGSGRPLRACRCPRSNSASSKTDADISKVWPSIYPGGLRVARIPRGITDDGVALVSTSHPKGPGLKRGRPTKEVAAARVAAIETVEIEIPLSPIVDDGKAYYAPLNKCPYCDRRRRERAEIMKRSRAKRKKGSGS